MSIIKVKTGGITADAITDALIADDVVGTEHLTANEVDTTALGADAVTAAQIADDAISEEHLDVTAITGHTAETTVADGDLVVIHDASASALRKMTVANLTANAGVAGISSSADATAMTITSAEKIGIGETTPLALVHIKQADSGQGTVDGNTSQLVIEDDSTAGITLLGGTSGTGAIFFGDSGDNDIGLIEYDHGANSMIFKTNATEQMRIFSTGQIGIGETSLGNNTLFVKGGTGSPLVTFYDQRSTSTFDVFAINSDFGGTETRHFLLEADGDIFNTNNSYGSLSDRKFKENETDANSQWNDIKALKIKNYNLKKFPDIKHLGVIAQDLEASGMNGLVYESFDKDENGVPTEVTTKSVKYSILYMKAIKALQETIAKVEALETENTAIKARLDALENSE